jgi:preprotein translocase, secY subunit
MNIFTTLRNAWKTSDLKAKIVFTCFIIILFRIGINIPVPFVNTDALQSFFSSQSSTLLGYFNMLSGNALAYGTLFALTIQPYINASIIIQLLTVAIPALERLQKDGGEAGKKKLKNATRFLTIGIGLIQAFGYYTIMTNGYSTSLMNLPTGMPEWFGIAIFVVLLLAGSMLVMWLGESIDEKGIGNGISIILFASIVSRGVSLVGYCVQKAQTGYWWIIPIFVVLGLVMFAFIVFMDSAERRIPIQYAKRQVGRKMYGGQSTFLPVKVAMTGVMPIIFTYAIVGLPATIAQFFPNSGLAKFVTNHFSSTSPIYIILAFVLIIAFNFFYISIQYNPVEISNNIKNNGGTIPGIRPGKPTSDFIIRVVNRVTIVGALFLGIIATVPYILEAIFGEAMTGLALGGTSVMILVSVALETVKQLESQMLMRQSKGFLR